MAFLRAVPRHALSVCRRVHTDSGSPLSGVRVLDLSRIVAGPYATMLLGDLGADIIKIERPGRGDECRHWGPPFLASGDSTYFLAVNRNKRSVCVDFGVAAGRDLVMELARESDVLVENFVPGKLAALGLGYEDVAAANPQLVYCSVTGYGLDSLRPGYDVVAASEFGLLSVTGPEGGEPCKVGVAMTDIATGLYAHGAILAALLARTTTGRGQQVACSLAATQLACLINQGTAFLNAGHVPRARGSAHESLVPYEAFPTADGHLTVGAGSDAHFQALARLIGLPELAIDPRYSRNADRVANRATLAASLHAAFKRRSTADWLTVFEGAAFPHGAVRSIGDALETPLAKRRIVDVGDGVRLVGPAVDFSESENRVRAPPPRLGQHTDDVLRQVLGLSERRLEELRAAGVVG